MTIVLLTLIALGVLVIGYVQHRHAQWVRQEFRKNTLAHGRIVSALPHQPFALVPVDRRKTSVWPGRQAAPTPDDWGDDFTRTGRVGVID